jgi:phosphatidylserine synthase
MTKPKLLLHAEGAAVLLTSCILYHQLQASWLWFAVLFLTPDFSMIGYLVNKKLGAAIYNVFHTYSVPLMIYIVLWFTGQTSYTWLLLIWVAHIAFDRLLGYGLKYDTAFKETHLNRVS